jgi:hypothetical protein
MRSFYVFRVVSTPSKEKSEMRLKYLMSHISISSVFSLSVSVSQTLSHWGALSMRLRQTEEERRK